MTKATYRAEFFTAADYAVRDIEAETPEQALQLARRFYDDDCGELDFRSYDDNAGIDQIQIWDNAGGTLASWESDDYRLRKAAPELLTALVKSEQRINQLCDIVNTLSHKLNLGDKVRKEHFNDLARDAIAKAKNRGS
jgi:hypothetical protein